MKILTVDDDDSFIDLIERSLTVSDNHEIVTAQSGTEAMNILTHEDAAFDCLLFDIQMPEVDGITLCRNVRNTARFSTTPIIMLTAMSQKHYLENAFAAGASDYLNKPFDFQELREKLRTWQRTDLAFHKPDVHFDGYQRVEARSVKASDADLARQLEKQGLKRLVEYLAFENFCVKRAQNDRRRFSVSALKMSNFEQLQDSLAADQFTESLFAFAKVLSASLDGMDAMFSYRGRGIFLMAYPTGNALLNVKLRAAMRRAVRQVEAREAVAQSRIRYVLGTPVKVAPRLSADALFALHAAVKSVETRNIEHSLDNVPTNLLGSLYLKDELSHLEARSYRALFNDELRDRDVSWPPRKMLTRKA
ncbi:response regulator [Roseovarius sp. EGI FJ00037]|uniref:response regulator n=1 Tax=Roseovarius salincola TaxID=2978479 RepID=UPI0022A6757C|nr:response regulator [Roseovarius sp. EGI FJ00037]MCZ0811697.1 response regulator [Roseovarius sp. EGI FJ00037]